MKYNFFVTKDSKVYFEGNYMEFYIPKYYFTDGISTMIGDNIQTLGIFHFGVYPSEDKVNLKDGKIYSLRIPLDIMVNFRSEYEDKRKLKKEIESEDYRIFTLNKGDEFLTQTNIIKGVDAVDKFVNRLLHAGKLPRDIPYGEIISMYHQCLEFNDFGLGVPSLTLESIISEIYRDSNDVSKPFRTKVGKEGNVSEFSYDAYRIDRIPSLNSTFAAVTFEDMNQALIESLLRNREGIEETPTPIENMLYY